MTSLSRLKMVSELASQAVSASPLPENFSDADAWTRAYVERLAAARGVPVSVVWAEQRAEQAAAAPTLAESITGALVESYEAEIARQARRT